MEGERELERGRGEGGAREKGTDKYAKDIRTPSLLRKEGGVWVSLNRNMTTTTKACRVEFP